MQAVLHLCCAEGLEGAKEGEEEGRNWPVPTCKCRQCYTCAVLRDLREQKKGRRKEGEEGRG
jgi:hypothetical protein